MTETDLILQWSLAALVGFVLLLRRQLTLFQPTTVYLVFHVAFFCIRPTLIEIMGFDSMWKRMEIVPEAEQLRLALLVSSAALVTFVAAFSITSARATPLDLPEIREIDDSDIRSLIITALVFAPLGIYAIVTDQSGNPAGIYGYTGDLRQVLIPISLLFLISVGWRWWGYLPFATCVALNDHQVGGPGTILLSILVLTLVWLWHHHRRSPTLAAVITGGTMAVLVVFGVHFRGELRDWIGGGEARSAGSDEGLSMVERVDRPEFAAFDCLTCIVATVPEKTKSYSHGVQHLAPLASLGFDSFASDSRADTSDQRIDLNKHGNFRGLPISLVGDGWISGGWIGVIITMSITGGALGIGYTLFTRNLGAPASACLFLVVHAAIAQLYRDSSTSILTLVLGAFIPLSLWRLLADRMRLARAASDEREHLRGRREQRRILGHAVLNPDAAPLPKYSHTADDEEESNDAEEPAAHDADDTPPAPPDEPTHSPPMRPQPRWHKDQPR